MELVKKNGEAINCWQDWERPKKDYQWKDVKVNDFFLS